MSTDYTTAIAAVIGLVVLLTGMTAYMLTLSLIHISEPTRPY